MYHGHPTEWQGQCSSLFIFQILFWLLEAEEGVWGDCPPAVTHPCVDSPVSRTLYQVYRPRESDKLIIFLKDVNLPKPDKYGTVQVVYFLANSSLCWCASVSVWVWVLYL